MPLGRGHPHRGARGGGGPRRTGVRWAPAGARVFNPAFDVTPVSLVTSLVTERGVVEGAALAAGGLARLA